MSNIKALPVDFDEFLRPVKAQLRSINVGFEECVGPCSTDRLLNETENMLGVVLPEELRCIYACWGESAVFRWETESLDYGFVGGRLAFPSLYELVTQRERYANSWMTSCDFEDYHVGSAEIARASAARMKSFLPLFVEPNGDAICLEVNTGRVVLDQHDWFDHGTGENGFLMADSLGDFLMNWRGVCFSNPRSAYWPTALTEQGVDWSARQFCEEFILPSSS